MNDNIKYKTLFFKFIYLYLNLNILEENFIKKGINKIDINCNELIKSNYFYLLNEVNIEKLNDNELKLLHEINLETIDNDKLYEFIINTYKKVFFKEDDQEFKYYGPMSDQYRVPSDCIALGCCFDKYGYFAGNKLTMEQVRSNYKYICDALNYLQFNANSKIKVAFVLYNEFYGKLEDRFVK